ncbi:MAG: metal-sulfur cluster assembly factor [Gemmatimonadetes bacterium]|nr:metal-sulfur cluster assembly factor [Gemmatimonadota bacterium]
MTLVQLERGRGDPRRTATLEEGMNFAAVLAESRGEGQVLPSPPEWTEPPADLAEKCRRALYEVSDPEFLISLVDLGLIYGISAHERSGEVAVRLTFTATACPCTDFIKWDIRERLLQLPEVSEVKVEEVWDPPWTTSRISDRGREILQDAGIAIIG